MFVVYIVQIYNYLKCQTVHYTRVHKRMVRDDWWHILALTPIALPIGAQIGSIGSLFIIAFVLVYPISLYKDSSYVNQTFSEWHPNPWIYAGIGLLVMLTLGILSYIVSPIYLYRRHKYS